LNSKPARALMLVLLALAFSTTGCNVINEMRAKNSLNEGVREFNKRKFDLAEAKFNRAMELAPDLPNAERFRAQSIFQQFTIKPGEELANKSLKALDDLIKHNPNNPEIMNEALASKAAVYEQLSIIASASSPPNPDLAHRHQEARFELLKQQAELPNQANKTKALVYYTIAREGYDQAKKISQSHRDQTKEMAKAAERKKAGESQDCRLYAVELGTPLNAEELQKVIPHVKTAREYIDKAVAADPNYAHAWSMRKLIYIQEDFIYQSIDKAPADRKGQLEQMIEASPARREQVCKLIQESHVTATRLYDEEKAAKAAEAGAS
jgi:hypothetical protein